MEKGSRVAVVCCSNGQPQANRESVELLRRRLIGLGLVPVFGEYIFERESVFSGTGKERAESLMNFYRAKEIQAIFDISGGDIANELLPYLDFQVIAESGKPFWGYSDLTTIINAIYTKTGKSSVLYQVRNLIYDDARRQAENFSSTVFDGTDRLFSFEYEFVRGRELKGIVVGGNIRCLLKLAGTEYWPDMTGKVLLLESRGGTVPQMTSYLNQLSQLGVFKRINGILLGSFMEMEDKSCRPTMAELVGTYAGEHIPVARTREIGHRSDSRGIVIGAKVCLRKPDDGPGGKEGHER